jgi:CBS domain-containing protein
VLANELAEEFPVVGLDTDACEAARLLAEHQLPGLVVTDRDGCPRSVLPASQVVRFLVPCYVQDDPCLAGVLSESAADRLVDRLRGKQVRDVIPPGSPELAVVHADDTILEVAAAMARLHSPLAAVLTAGRLTGVITAARLLHAALTSATCTPVPANASVR